MGSGISINQKAHNEAEPKRAPSLAKEMDPQQRMPRAKRSQIRSTESAANKECTNFSILQETQAKILRCRMRPVASSDLLLMSQRACAQFMFRMPGVNDPDSSLLKRMLSNAGKTLAPSDQHCVFVVDGCGLHEDLLACAAVAPRQRDCYRWQRAIAAALSNIYHADAMLPSPLEAIHAAASAAKQNSKFDKQYRKSLEPVGLHEMNGTEECTRDVLAKIAAISQSFEDCARSAACDLEHVLRGFSSENSVPDASILEGKRIMFAASNAQRSRGYAVTASSQFVLWYRPSSMAPLGNVASFRSSDFSRHPIPRISRPLPPASDHPSLLSNDVLMWEGLYKQLCIATECTIEAIIGRNSTQLMTNIMAPPLASRIERGGLVFICLQETPTFGLTGKHLGQVFGGNSQVNVVLGLDSISKAAPAYKPFDAFDGSNLSHFIALSTRTLYTTLDSLVDESSFSSSPSISAASGPSIGSLHGHSQVDSFSFTPGLVVYSIPELNLNKRSKKSTGDVVALFVQPMWIEMPHISVSWTSNGRVLESASLTLPYTALVKFCNTCEDEEYHPNFGAVVCVTCDVGTTDSNVRSRPATASEVSRLSQASDISRNKRQFNAALLSEKRWSIFALTNVNDMPEPASQWATNSLKSLCCCVQGVSSCVNAIVSSVKLCFSDIFDLSQKTAPSPCRCIFDLFGTLRTLRDSHGCRDISFLPMILKQTSMISKIALGVLYADLICEISADAIINICNDHSDLRLALYEMYSIVVDESNMNSSITKLSTVRCALSEPQFRCTGIESWWENSVSVSSCARALNAIKMLPLFQAEFGTARSNSSCILETFLQNVWLSRSNVAADCSKKNSLHLSRAEFNAYWIRAMAARTMQSLVSTEPIDDWIDTTFKKLPSPCLYQLPLGWFAHIHHKASVQKTTALLVLEESWCKHHNKSDEIVHVTSFCEIFCRLRFLLSSNLLSKSMRSRSVDDASLPRTNNYKHQDPSPHVIPPECEASDNFLPKPRSSSTSLLQQSAADLLDVGPLNFNQRSQRIPLASTFGSASWISPVYISPIEPKSESFEVDAGLYFINRICSTSSSIVFDNQSSRTDECTSKQLSEPQSTLECVLLLHSLALKLLDVTFVFDLQFALNALADVLIILGIIGSVHFDRASGAMLPLNRRSSQMCQDMAATLYLRSMSLSRLNIGASCSMFRMMCTILSNGQATLITRNFMPLHIRDFLLNGDVSITELEEHPLVCVALTDAIFAKILNTHAVWIVEMGFQNGDPVLDQTCKRAQTCDVESVQIQSKITVEAKKPLDWVLSALACPMIHTFSPWLSSCNPEAPLIDAVVVTSTKVAHHLRSTAQVLANAYASAIAASALPSTSLDVSCLLVGYASMCCKFFGEWAWIEKMNMRVDNKTYTFCPCQMLFGIVACIELPVHRFSESDDSTLIGSTNADIFEDTELTIRESSNHLLVPCMCDMLALLTHHEHGDKLTSYDPALLCYCICPSRAFCDVSFKHLGQYCSDSTLLLVESALRCRYFKKCFSEDIQNSGASLMSLNASSCLFVRDQSMLNLISQSSGRFESAASSGKLQCLCLDGCLYLTRSFMSKLSSLHCVSSLECLVLPSFEQSSVLMGSFVETMQQKVAHRFETPFTFDEFTRQMKSRPEKHDVVDQLGHRSVQIIDPSLSYIASCSPNLSDALQTLLLRGCREDSYSAHQELMGRFAIATTWCREMRKLACEKEAILFERNRTQIFAANQWREIDSKSGKAKSDDKEDDDGHQQVPAVQDGSTNLWASNEKIKNVSVMMGRLEKMAQMTAVVRDQSSTNPIKQYVSQSEVFDSVVDSFIAIQSKQDQSRYVSLSGNLTAQLRQQKKDFYVRQLSTRARIRTALLHCYVRISARLCVAGQGATKTAALMHVPSEQSAEYCRHMLNLVANSFEGPGCDGESIVELLRCTPNLLHLSFVRAHPFASSRLIDLLALRMSKTLVRMKQLWALWDEYKVRLGRMSFQRSIHYERVPVKESIVTDHIGFHDRHCILASKYLPKLVFLDLAGLKNVSDVGRSAFFINCANIQVVLGSAVGVTPMTNECLLTLASRALPPLQILFPYLLSKARIHQNDAQKESQVSTFACSSSINAKNCEVVRHGMMWSLQEHLSKQIVANMSRKEREAAARAKAEQERKEKLLQHVAFRLQTRRNILLCKAAITSHQGKTARLRWMRLNELANFNPALRDSLGLSAATVMAPETGQTKFGEPRYEYADCTPSMLSSSLLRIRFQVLQLSLQCCQTPERIKRNLMRVKSSNRTYDDPFIPCEEIFGDPTVLKDPCQVFIRVTVEGKPDRMAKRVKGLRLSHDKYFTSCNAGPIDIRTVGDCMAPIMMRQTGYLVIPEISSRVFLELWCQSYTSDAQMITAIPVKALLMPRVLDEPRDCKIELKYAPKLQDDDVTLNSGLQQAYYKNKKFVLNGGVQVGYVLAEITVMSPWQVDLMVAQNQSRKSKAPISKTDSEPVSEHVSQNSKKPQSIQEKRKEIGVNFDPNDTHECVSLAESSMAAFPLKMHLYGKYDRGNVLAGLLLQRDRLLQGDAAIVRCRAPVGLSGLLVDHSESWEIFKRQQMRMLQEMTTRWNKGGFIQKLTKVLTGSQGSVQPTMVIDDIAQKVSDDAVVPVLLEGIASKVDARTYLFENRDQDSDFEEVEEPEKELELVGDGAMNTDQQLMISSINRLVEYCVDTVTTEIIENMTFHRPPFGDLRHMRCLELDNSIVTDTFFLDCFDLLIGLRSLSIAGCKRLTSATMLCLAQSPSAPYLQFLDVSRVCDWNSETVAALCSTAKSLIEVRMDYDMKPSLTDGCVLLMSQNMKHLSLLSLNGVQSLANESVSGLMEQARNLRSLSIAGLGFMNDLSLQYAHKCRHLVFLNISFAILVTDEGLRHIATCRQLRTLLMQNLTEVTDNGLVILGAGCGQLQCLDIIGCERLSPRGPDAVLQLCPFLYSVSVDATPAMRAWKIQVEGVGSTSNVQVLLNYAAPT